MNAPTHADATQVAGTHYKQLPIQPWNYTAANGLNWFEGEVVKYITRWQHKGGVDDLRKAHHIIEKMVELAMKFGWPGEQLTECQLAELMDPHRDARAALVTALKAVGDGLVERGRGGDAKARSETTHVPATDDAAIERAVEATQQITDALKTCAAIQQGIASKPFPLHTALRTTLKHTESSLLTALRDLQGFRDIVRENGAHE